MSNADVEVGQAAARSPAAERRLRKRRQEARIRMRLAADAALLASHHASQAPAVVPREFVLVSQVEIAALRDEVKALRAQVMALQASVLEHPVADEVTVSNGADDKNAVSDMVAVTGVIARLESAQQLGASDFLEIWDALTASLMCAIDVNLVWVKTTENNVRSFLRDCLTPPDPGYEHHLICDVMTDIVEDFRLFVVSMPVPLSRRSRAVFVDSMTVCGHV